MNNGTEVNIKRLICVYTMAQRRIFLHNIAAQARRFSFATILVDVLTEACALCQVLLTLPLAIVYNLFCCC